MQEMIRKSAQAAGLELAGGDMEKINALTLRTLEAEEVFAFKVVMCDNEVDRDFEYFPLATLRQMAGLFKGKTVISDHAHSAAGQVARIYDTEVEAGEGTSKSGETYHRLVAKCYMVRTEANKDLISDIEAGIRKEVSVGCAIERAVCSVCGADNRKTYCKHYPGTVYDGRTCFFALEGAKDAYELSFVAVPAQPRAGVTKNYGAEEAPEHTGGDEAVMRLELAGVDAFLFTHKHKIDMEDENDEQKDA